MNGEGRRQLPTWMLRRCTVEETSNTEVKQQNDSEVVVANTSQMQKKVQRRKHSSEVASVETKSQLLEQSEARTRDTNSSHQEEDQHDQEPYVLKKCRTGKSKRNNKRANDQPDELHRSKPETNDGSTRKRYRSNTSGEKKTKKKKKKKKKTNVSVENSYDTVVPSEDELTVEDLVSIAEEYIRADMMESENLQLNSKARSEKDRTAQKKDMKPHTQNQLPFESISTGEEIIDPLDTGNPAEDMLNLLLGGFLRRSKESERKNDAKTITKNIVINHEISRKSQNDDTVGEVVPAMKKKVSLKDKVAMLFD